MKKKEFIGILWKASGAVVIAGTLAELWHKGREAITRKYAIDALLRENNQGEVRK